MDRSIEELPAPDWNEDLDQLNEGASDSIEPRGEVGRKLQWDMLHVTALLGVIVSYLYHWMQQEDPEVFIRIAALTIGVGIATAVVWRFSAIFSIQIFDSLFDILHGKNDYICRIRSPQSKTGSMLDHLFMAVEWCFFPTLVVFFVLSFIAQAIAPSGRSVMDNDWIWVFMFIIPPLTTFIAVPIRLLTDSSLMRFDIQNRNLEPFGLTFKRMFRAIGGVGALASFAKVALDKGGVRNAMTDTFTILLYVYPLLFIATIFYGIWHPGYMRQVEKKIERFHYQQYSFRRERHGILSLIPLSGDTIAPEIPSHGGDAQPQGNDEGPEMGGDKVFDGTRMGSGDNENERDGCSDGNEDECNEFEGQNSEGEDVRAEYNVGNGESEDEYNEFEGRNSEGEDVHAEYNVGNGESEDEYNEFEGRNSEGEDVRAEFRGGNGENEDGTDDYPREMKETLKNNSENEDYYI